MGIFDAIKHQLVDIIEWTDNTTDTLVWRFPRYENEIKYGAKLVVRESQAAAFINEGKLADVFGPGTYTLQTQNMPVLATLRGWKYGFESPFKAEVYFVSTRTITDRKWGTKNPIMLRDAEFGPVRLRAFGSYALRVSDPAAFLRQVAGTEGRFTIDQVEDQLRDLVVTRFADALGSSKIPALDLAGNYDQLGQYITAKIQPDFATFGLQVVNLLVENISLPPEVEAALDKRTSMGVIGDLGKYTQYETANAIKDAARNPGGIAGAGAGIAVGYAMGNQMAGAMNAAVNAPSTAPSSGGANSGAMSGPPPLPQKLSIYFALDGKQAGPFDDDAIQQKIASGELTRATLAWKQGMPSWIAAEHVPELGHFFAAVPPAIPKL
jgi:membrane protease subunit (stomatin/prohibitin family)